MDDRHQIEDVLLTSITRGVCFRITCTDEASAEKLIAHLSRNQHQANGVPCALRRRVGHADLAQVDCVVCGVFNLNYAARNHVRWLARVLLKKTQSCPATVVSTEWRYELPADDPEVCREAILQVAA